MGIRTSGMESRRRKRYTECGAADKSAVNAALSFRAWRAPDGLIWQKKPLRCGSAVELPGFNRAPKEWKRRSAGCVVQFEKLSVFEESPSATCLRNDSLLVSCVAAAKRGQSEVGSAKPANEVFRVEKIASKDGFVQ